MIRKSLRNKQRETDQISIYALLSKTFSLFQIVINSIEIMKLNVNSFKQPLLALPFERACLKTNNLIEPLSHKGTKHSISKAIILVFL